MTMLISVVICTRNPRVDHFSRVLGALRAQTLDASHWELLLVDNGSHPPARESCDLSWHPHYRHLDATKTGKTFALLEAAHAFRGELFVIVDDDNVLRDDYLESSLRLAQETPFLGAWAGSCIPEYEVEPEAELRPWLSGLVVEKLQRPFWANLPRCTEALPPGAGMVVRREVAQRWAERASNDPLRMLLGPNDNSPGAGDDADMALCGLDFGLGAGRFPELELTHLIPARKLTIDYLEKLHFGQSYAGLILERLYNKSVAYPGQLRSGHIRLVLVSLLLLATGRPRTERRIRMAIERAKLAAARDWEAAQCRSSHGS